MEYKLNILEYISHLTTEVPVIGGALSVSLAGGILGALWKGPGILRDWFENIFCVSFTLNNGGYGKNINHYVGFMQWFEKGEFHKFSRNTGYQSGTYDNEDGGVGPAVGKHFILVDGTFYWVKIKELPSTGSNKPIHEIRIGTFGFGNSKLLKLFDAFKDKEGDSSIPTLRNFNKEYWEKGKPIANRSWDTVILEQIKKDELINTIDDFLGNRQWYLDRGIPYKLVILLYGPPGTGKTSLIKAISNKYNQNTGILNLHLMSDVSLPRAIQCLPKNTILAIEDFDTAGAVKKRTDNKDDPGSALSELAEGLNLSTILNTLDGLSELNGQIIFMTTNHPEKLDGALTRSGRVDLMMEIPWLNSEEIAKYTSIAFPGVNVNLEGINSLPGSDVQKALLANKHDSEGFRDRLLIESKNKDKK